MALPLKLPCKQLIVAALAAATGIGAWLVLFPNAAAPQVQFATIAGESVSTADLRGKVVLVNFWATSCVSCVAEMPKIVETYQKYRDQGFETVAVAMSYDPPNHVLAYAVNNKLPFKVAFDPIGGVARSFGGVDATPTSFVIDRRGRIVERWVGEPDFGRLHELLESKLREPA